MTRSQSGPDLVVEFSRVNLPDTVEMGAPGDVQLTVTNEGEKKARGEITLNLISSSDPDIQKAANLDTGELGPDVLLGQLTETVNLKSGESQTFNIAYDNITSPVAPGSYDLIAQLVPGDTGNLERENTSNNVTTELVSAPGTDVVLDWNATLFNLFQIGSIFDDVPEVGVAPPEGSRAAAITHAAIHDAVVAIEGGYEPIYVDLEAPEGASAKAAVVGAAHAAMVGLFPSEAEKEQLGRQLEQSLAEISQTDSAEAIEAGFEFGERVAEKLLKLRENDLDVEDADDYPYEPREGRYVWRPGEEGIAVGAGYGDDAVPFAIPSSDEFLPPPPPAFGSDQYAEEIEEVRRLGGAEDTALTDVVRTEEQSEIALFWLYDRSDSYRPFGQWNQIAQEIAVREGNSLVENARLFAQLNIAIADAVIVGWDAKYTYAVPRPGQTITELAGSDGRKDTVGDPEWESFVDEPPFPDYVSGHGMLGPAAVEVLESTFGENYAFEAVSQELPGVVRSFGSFDEAALENGLSRLYAGAHNRSAALQGLENGTAVGEYVVANISQPTV